MGHKKNKIKDFVKTLLCAAVVGIVCTLVAVLEVITDGEFSPEKLLLMVQLLVGAAVIIGAIVHAVRNIVYRLKGRKGKGDSWQRSITNALGLFFMLELGVWMLAGGINEYAVTAGLPVKVKHVTSNIIYIVPLLILPAVGGMIIAVGAFKNRMRMPSHGTECGIRAIQGRVVSYEEVSSVLGKRLKPVLEYSLNGLDCLLTVTHEYTTRKVPEIGERIEIYYSPELEKTITRDEKKDNIRLIAFGAIVLAAGVLIFIYNYM